MLIGVLMIISIGFSLPLCTDYVGTSQTIEEDPNNAEDLSPVPSSEMVTKPNNNSTKNLHFPTGAAVNTVDINNEKGSVHDFEEGG